jgi:glycosyltransferase involved in cell wall biosynthesis
MSVTLPEPPRVAIEPAPARARVVFFNRSYWPDAEATGQLLTDLTEDLAGRFDIEVVAGMPNSVVGELDANAASASATHRAGVKIRRLRHTRFGKRSFLGKACNLFTFWASAAATTFTLPDADVVVTETDPFLLPLVGRWLQKRRGCKHIVYLQDIYPDVAVAVGKLKEGRLSRWLRKRLFSAYAKADRVVVLSRDMAERCRRYGVPSDRIRVIPNWADTSVVHPRKGDNAFRKQNGLQSAFVVMYSGNLGMVHQLQPILQAAAALRASPEIQFLFVGEGVRKADLQRQAREQGLTNVRFLPYQPRETLADSLSAADLHVVSMDPATTELVMPSKLYGVLAVGSPVAALVDPGSELSEIVRKHEVGYVCDSRDPSLAAERLAYVVNFLASHRDVAEKQGASARKLAEEQYDRRLQTARFAGLLDEVLAENRSAVRASDLNSGSLNADALPDPQRLPS